MNDFIKFIFFIVAAIFFVSYVQDSGPLLGNPGSFSLLGGTNQGPAAYTRSYDSNNDGTISDAEYKQGELDRIAQELLSISQATQKALDEKNRSPYYGMVNLEYGNTYTDSSREEYVVVAASSNNPAPIVISGWKLESIISGTRVSIPQGVALLEGAYPQRHEQNVFLAPGERAIINSRYAVGINTGFLENKCTGYIDPRYTISPPLTRSCPSLKNENLSTFGITPSAFHNTDAYDTCMDGIESARSCERGSYASTTPSICKAFIKKYSTYDGCLELHKTDSDFFGDTWRLFLGSNKDVWRNEREAIALIDDSGKVVDILKLY
ncbi:hypothetical protein IPJ70_02965 [Candidatus Campbellbacteria bacterium]|nr:MAG: hypothetical protein IPJ70_02965 [Candidatus Campbellbacteria bacterium]